MSPASRPVPRLEACDLDVLAVGRHEPEGWGATGRRSSRRHVSGGRPGGAVVDVRALQSLRIVLPPPVHPAPADAPARLASGEETSGWAPDARPWAPDARPWAPDAGDAVDPVLWEPTFDELLRGPGSHRGAGGALAGLPLLVRLAGRARRVSPRRAAGAAVRPR